MKMKWFTSIYFIPAVLCVHFTPPELITNEDNFVTVGIILVDILRNRFSKLKQSVNELIDSVYFNSDDVNIHFLVITDQHSIKGSIKKIINHFLI